MQFLLEFGQAAGFRGVMRSTGMSGMGVIQPASPRRVSRKSSAKPWSLCPFPSSDSALKFAAVEALAEAGGQQFGGNQVVDRVSRLAFGRGGQTGQLIARISPTDRNRRSSSTR